MFSSIIAKAQSLLGRKKPPPRLGLVRVSAEDKDAMELRAMQLWATDRQSSEGQELFREKESSCRTHKATLKRVQ